MGLVSSSHIEKHWREALSRLEVGALDFVAPNGDVTTVKGTTNGPKARFVVNDWDVLKRVAARGDIGLGEDYIAGAWETDDVETLVSLFLMNMDQFDDSRMGAF